MPTFATSADGTRIAFERSGSGSPLIVADGAMCRRGLGPSRDLATRLAAHFSVIAYDRRGRGDSGDTPPYAVEREVDDIAALMDMAGGSASLLGMSSGAVLALDAANRLPGVRTLVLYEPPLILDAGGPRTEQHWTRIGVALAAQDRGAAVREFLRMVGVPAPFAMLMRVTPLWSRLTAIAHTLRYDGSLMAGLQEGRPLPTQRWASVTAPTLVLAGARSPQWLRSGARTLASAVANGEHQVVQGQSHNVSPRALAPILREFLARQGIS